MKYFYVPHQKIVYERTQGRNFGFFSEELIEGELLTERDIESLLLNKQKLLHNKDVIEVEWSHLKTFSSFGGTRFVTHVDREEFNQYLETITE